MWYGNEIILHHDHVRGEVPFDECVIIHLADITHEVSLFINKFVNKYRFNASYLMNVHQDFASNSIYNQYSSCFYDDFIQMKNRKFNNRRLLQRDPADQMDSMNIMIVKYFCLI